MAIGSESATTAHPRGRYAPSPTGELHLGNASTALLAWLSARSRGGVFVMRMEDLDRPRVRPELAGKILDDLRWLGIDWDEGPDCSGPHAPYDQQSRRERYAAAFDRLRGAGCVYCCFCSRREIAAAASAPHGPDDERRYPGTCRGLDPREAEKRIRAGEQHAWRFRVDPSRRPAFDDLVIGHQSGTLAPDDFVVWRSDRIPAYQLSVVVDDAAMQITEVIRGGDLLHSTPRQLLLFESLGEPAPRFGHVPLLLGSDGIRLSKRHRGVTLRELREAGLTARQIVGRLAWLLGLQAGPEPRQARDLVRDFSWAALTRAPRGIRLPEGTFS